MPSGYFPQEYILLKKLRLQGILFFSSSGTHLQVSLLLHFGTTYISIGVQVSRLVNLLHPIAYQSHSLY